jgi:hypothetical protein
MDIPVDTSSSAAPLERPETPSPCWSLASFASPQSRTKTRLASASFLLFLVVTLVYIANGRTVGAGDSLPARHLPFSLLREGNFDFDEFPPLYSGDALRIYPVLDGIPYFLRYRDGHYFSTYTPGPGILAVPVYVLPVLAGVSAAAWAPGLEKVSAADITALSVVFLFWALAELVSRRWAVVVAVIYAFGTSSLSVSSQALWQHGPSQLFLTLFLFCLVRGMKEERFLAYAMFAMSSAIVMRPTDVLIALPVAACTLYTRPRSALRLGLFALPPMAGLLLYYARSGLADEGVWNTTTPMWAFFAQVPLVHGLAGLLLSPGRGLFVYSPVLLFSVAGLLWVALRGPALLKATAVGVVLNVLVVSKWFVWWGGHSFGPRLLADTAPILCFFLYPVTKFLDRHRIMKGVFVLFAVLSIGIHAIGAFFYDGRWDAQADIERSEAPLWSWSGGPLIFYGGEAVSVIRQLLMKGRPTSADSPALLAASYRFEPQAAQTFVGERLRVHVEATNTGRAIWLAALMGNAGPVRLGWRWSRDQVDLPETGRMFLASDVSPGQVARFAPRIACPLVPGDYTLTIDLLSENVTWFADQGGPPIRMAVKVRPLDLEHFLSEPVGIVGRAPALAISTDRSSYRRGETLRLTMDAFNPYYPGRFDAYLLRQGPDGDVWSYDGRQLLRATEGGWISLIRDLPLPARATRRVALPLSDLAPGAYRWHVVLTEAGTYRQVAKAAAAFSVEP